GWIYFDPGAIRRYEELGIPNPLGYIASRSVPLMAAGPDAVNAAFGSISPIGIAIALDLVRQHTTADALWAARNEAVKEGLAEYAPGIVEPLRRLGPLLWPVVERLPTVGRVLFAAHLGVPRPDDALLNGWHAVNCLREWRGDTHWAIVAANGLTGVEASVLHNLWLGYDEDGLPNSRGTTADDIAMAKRSLADRGLLGAEGVRLREHIEEETDRRTTLPWELLGEDESIRFAEDLEPPCELLL